MQVKAGSRLKSVVCDTEVVVVRGPSSEASIECGGRPMVAIDADASREARVGESGEAAKLGKRYVDEELGLELLCTKAGDCGLSVDGRALTLKGAKALPSSD